MPMPLTDADLLKLQSESWANPVTAEQFGLIRVSSHEGAELVGRNDHGDYQGIVYPIFFPGDLKPREYFLRRDHPEMEKNSDGILKSKRKYLGPPGRGNKLLFGPGELVETLDDVRVPIVLTEGLKKLLAAYQLARFDSEQPRFLSCALSGVWNWRGVTGKTTDANGARVDEKGVISDFDRIDWAGREVVIIFDSDCATNEKVAAARRGLVVELKRRGARVSVIDLPVLEGMDKTGFDDFLAQRGPEEALQLISNSIHAYKSDPPHESNFTPIAANQLLSDPPEEIEWVHDDYLAVGGLGVLAGKPKEGKTTYAYELAIKVALGLPFLDRSTRKGAVLILALEEHA